MFKAIKPYKDIANCPFTTDEVNWRSETECPAVKNNLRSKLKISAYIFGIVYLCLIGLMTYWFFQQSINFSILPVTLVQQIEGTPVIIDIPVKKYSRFTDFFLHTSTVDLMGNSLRQTKRVKFDSDYQYKLLTYSKLVPGYYNVVMTIDYKLNPIEWRQQEFLLNVLQVVKKDKP